jgi:hypothetical protein
MWLYSFIEIVRKITFANSFLCKRTSLENNISKKHFRPGGMAASEWTRSVRAVRDTPVAEYSAPGVNTTGRVAYRPPMAISPFLLALLVCYNKQTLWRCGQL